MTAASEPDPITGQPVGLQVDATPARRPGPVTLPGRYGRVERLDMRHADDLWQACAGHDHIWTYMSGYGPFADAGAFTAWLASRIALTDPYSYAVADPSGRALGIATLMEIRPQMRVCEVGHIVYSPALMRTPPVSRWSISGARSSAPAAPMKVCAPPGRRSWPPRIRRRASSTCASTASSTTT